MREVKFKKWIPKQKDNANSNKWESDFINDGFFHEWGLDIIEYETTTASFTVGIIEDFNGEVHVVNPMNIKFITD